MSQKETNNEPMNDEPMNNEPTNNEPTNNEPMELDDHTASQLQQFATELAEDYTGYLKVDCFQESRRLQEKIDDYLGILEEFCSILESIRQDCTICVEEHLPAVIERSRQIQKLYGDIDRIEAVVSTVKKTVDDVDVKVTEAESVLGKPVIIRRLFNTLFGSSPRKSRKNGTPASNVQYVEPFIFKSSDYFIESSEPVHSLDPTLSSHACEDLDEEIVVRSHKSRKHSANQ